MTQLPEVDGPHHLPHGEQERCVVEGRRIDGSGLCTVIAIRDRKRHGWVLYPHGAAGLGVLIADDAESGSCAIVNADPNQTDIVIKQWGPRRLWDEVEFAYQWWVSKGRPAHDRFGISVSTGLAHR